MDIWIWLGIAIFCIIFEFITVDLISVWFAVGGVVSLIVACFTNNLLAEFVVFVLVSVLSLLCTRKFALKLLNNSNEKTNVDSFIGKKLKLDESKENYVYKKINGVEWKLCSNDESIISKGEYEIIKCEGNKLLIKKSEEQKEKK